MALHFKQKHAITKTVLNLASGMSLRLGEHVINHVVVEDKKEFELSKRKKHAVENHA